MTALHPDMNKALPYLMVREIFTLIAIMTQIFNNIFFFLTAPVIDSIRHLCTNSLEVSLASYAKNTQVSFFRIGLTGGSINETCTLQRAAETLNCPFAGLFSGMQYTMRAVACMPNQQGCSKVTKTTTWTIPQGMPYSTIGEIFF